MIDYVFVCRALLCSSVISSTFIGIYFVDTPIQSTKILWAVWLVIEWVSSCTGVKNDDDPVSKYIIPGIATMFFFGKNIN